MSDSLFPFIDADVEGYIIENNLYTELPIPKEYAWDFENNQIVLENGKSKIVEGIEAIKVWIYKALNTARNKYIIYNEDYGSEKELLIATRMSHDMLESEAKMVLEEALYVNPYINSIDDIAVDTTKHLLVISFVVKTNFGQVEVSI